MEALFPGSRGKRKQGRSHSLPARIDPATPSEFEGERSELLANEHHGIESKSQSHPQAREAISTRSATRKSYLRPSDDWSYLEPDERGAELGEEARVWKVYVGETDKSDAELVDGWNKTLDVLLGRTLFGYINRVSALHQHHENKLMLAGFLTDSFLIESSGMLKQDPNDVSAAALMVISQALVTIAINNYTTGPSAIPLPVQTNAPDFVPSKNAVIINTLWYLSLSLSIATAFLAMLAKDWCHSFSANRTGHPRTQAHRRQRKWKLIERWKMQELIALLPSFVHLSLLLFSVGLCIYLWDLNNTTAIPVMCVVGGALFFYIWSSITASIVEFFPYTTIVSRTIRSKHTRVFLAPLVFAAKSVVASLAHLAVFVATICYMPLIGLMFMITRLLCGPVLLLDKYTFQIVAKPEVRVRDLLRSCAFITTFPLLFTWRILGSLVRRIRSSIKQTIKRFELSDDLVTSLALSWLIRYCETPSAIDIALQAIAGASKGVPRNPLLLGDATSRIMQRIVSHRPTDREELETELYTQGLYFLGAAGWGDIEAMVWDWKSKNEGEIAKLVKDGRFIPNPDNLEAMKIGHSAASQSLSIWKSKKGSEIPARILDSITQLLSRHVRSGNTQLHPAAVQSLANAAAIHTTLSIFQELPSGFVSASMKYCQRLISETPDEVSIGLPEFKRFGAGANFIVCILLHGHSTVDKQINKKHSTRRPYRARHAIRALIDSYLSGSPHECEVFWIGCMQILSQPTKYGLDEESGNAWEPLRVWCSGRAHSLLCLSSNPLDVLRGPGIIYLFRDSNNAFVAALNQVYEAELASKSHNSMSTYLSEPIYAILIKHACYRTTSSWQREICVKMLANSDFPNSIQPLIEALWRPVVKSFFVDRLIWVIGRCYSDIPRSPGWFIAATQLWLLLRLAGGLSPEDQQTLVRLIERTSGLPLQAKGLDQVLHGLESDIIQDYRQVHRNSGKLLGDNENASGSVGRFMVKPVRQPFLQFGNPPGTDNEEIRTHQRVYMARVVKCIVTSDPKEDYKDLELLIQHDFRNLPSCLHNVTPLPPPRAGSIASVRTQDAPGPQEINTEHILVDLYSSSGRKGDD